MSIVQWKQKKMKVKQSRKYLGKSNVVRNMRGGVEFEMQIKFNERGSRKQDEISAVGSQI